jgi:PncC family amidohydrolase
MRILAAKIVELAEKAGEHIVTVESCTGGRVASAITAVAGSSAVFWAGIVTYDNSIKEALVKVDRSTLDKYGAVSRECAMQMVVGGMRASQATLGISVTGIAGPSGGSLEKPVGTVYFGLGHKGKTVAVVHCRLPYDRIGNQEAATAIALELLLRRLEGQKIALPFHGVTLDDVT